MIELLRFVNRNMGYDDSSGWCKATHQFFVKFS